MENLQEQKRLQLIINQEDNIRNLSFKPIPSDRELEWDKTKILMSKTDYKGNILYANEAFIDVCGYDDFELMDKSHNILRHPDMPKVIFKLMWEDLQKNQGSHIIIKNMSKTGRFFWIANDIKTNIDQNGTITYTGQQSSVSNDIIKNKIEPLYKKLIQIENASGVNSSENYLVGYLEEQRKTLMEFIDELTYNIDNPNEETEKNDSSKNKGLFSGLFSKNKK
jgi:PAS domain S-box-containing protein